MSGTKKHGTAKVGRPAGKLAHPRPSESSDEEDSCHESPEHSRLPEYLKNLEKKFYRDLRVAVVFDPVVGNHPWAYTQGGKLTGAAIEFLRAVASHIPGVKRLLVQPKDTTEDALEAIVAGGDNDSVLTFPVQITRQLLLHNIGVVATDTTTCTNQLLVFLTSTASCSVATTVAGASNPLAAIEASSCTPPLTILLPQLNLQGQILLQEAGIPVSTSTPLEATAARYDIIPTVTTTTEVTGLLTGPNVALLLPCPSTTNLTSIPGVTVLPVVSAPATTESLFYRPSTAACSINAALSETSSTNPLVGIAALNEVQFPNVILVPQGDTAALALLASESALGSQFAISSLTVTATGITPALVGSLNGNSVILATASLFTGSVTGTQALSALVAAGDTVLPINGGTQLLIFSPSAVVTNPDLASTLNPFAAILASQGPACPLLVSPVIGGAAGTSAQTAIIANYPTLIGSATTFTTAAAFIAYVNGGTLPAITALLIPTGLFTALNLQQLLGAGNGVVTVLLPVTPGGLPQPFYLIFNPSVATCSIYQSVTGIALPTASLEQGVCSLVVDVAAGDSAAIDAITAAGLTPNIIPGLTAANLSQYILPGNVITGALLPTTPAPGGNFNSVPSVTYPAITASVVEGNGVAVYRPAFRTELSVQAIVDLLIADGTYNKILKRFGLTASSVPTNSILPPVFVPPPYYSLTQGFIPQVGVYEEAPLNSLLVEEDSHEVQVVLFQPNV